MQLAVSFGDSSESTFFDPVVRVDIENFLITSIQHYGRYISFIDLLPVLIEKGLETVTLDDLKFFFCDSCIAGAGASSAAGAGNSDLETNKVSGLEISVYDLNNDNDNK
jgi:hypothetical protein